MTLDSIARSDQSKVVVLQHLEHLSPPHAVTVSVSKARRASLASKTALASPAVHPALLALSLQSFLAATDTSVPPLEWLQQHLFGSERRGYRPTAVAGVHTELPPPRSPDVGSKACACGDSGGLDHLDHLLSEP